LISRIDLKVDDDMLIMNKYSSKCVRSYKTSVLRALPIHSYRRFSNRRRCSKLVSRSAVPVQMQRPLGPPLYGFACWLDSIELNK
jgi:hypothetical protein